MIIEVCVDGVDASLAAEQQGASRVELCADLDVGGTSPDAATIEQTVKRCAIGVHVMIRPRGGDFHYTENELRRMQSEIQRAGRLGARGVVFGVLTEAGEFDEPRTAILLNLARERGLQVTFHRAFDECVDAMGALDRLIHLRVDHLLTSGQQESAYAGREMLRRLSQQAKGRINLIAAAGIRPQNAEEIARCGMQAIHFTARRKITSSQNDAAGDTWEFDAQKVHDIVQRCKNL